MDSSAKVRKYLQVGLVAVILALAKPVDSGTVNKKKEFIDESALPDLRSLMESVGLSKIIPALEKRGYERTRQLLKWGRSDVQLLGAELDFTKEVGVELLSRIEELKRSAIRESPTKAPDKLAELRRKRDDLAYGRIYVSRSTATFDFKKAWFGSSLPVDSLKLIRAIPANGCRPLSAEVYGGAAVLADRGGCTFAEKAWNAVNATAMIVINSNGMPFDRPASGYATDEAMTPTPANLAVVLCEAAAGPALLKVSQAPLASQNRRLEAAEVTFVPLQCRASEPDCKPLLPDELAMVSHVDSGHIYAMRGLDSQFEFVAAAWGGVLPAMPAPLVLAYPRDLCTAPPRWLCRKFGILCHGPEAKLFARAAPLSSVLADRGGCSFGTKAAHAASIGAAALVVTQFKDKPLLRMGIRSPQLPPGIPAVLIDREAGEALRQAVLAAATYRMNRLLVEFVPARTNFADKWLELDSIGEWPDDDTAADLLLKRLQSKNSDSSLRLAWLRNSYANRTANVLANNGTGYAPQETQYCGEKPDCSV